MMKKNKKMMFGVLLGASAILMAACGSEEKESSKANSDELYTIDVFDTAANFMGVQKGWFGKEVKDRFNLELNVIAPNVAGSGDTLYQTRTAAGNLGDLVIADTAQKYKELVEAGLLYDMSDLYPEMKNLNKYDDAVKYLNKEDGIYGIPIEVTTSSPLVPSEGIQLNVGPYIRWDLYEQMNYPKIGTLEDLLPLLNEMQKKESTTENGKKVYGFSLFGDWDGDYLANGVQLAQLYGYSTTGYVLAKADAADYQSIIANDSLYMRAMKFYYEANQLGILDPESTTQNYDTLWSKVKDGQVLYSWFPWLGQAAYNTSERVDQGKGFMLASIEDQKNFSNGAKVNGGALFVGIGANAENPEQIAKFIDWLYSPEGVELNDAQVGGAAGIKDKMWKIENEQPVLTDLGKEIFIEKGAETEIPSDLGGGTFKDGVSPLNVKTVLGIDKNPETDNPYYYQMWESYIKENANPLTENWSKHMDGAQTAVEWLEKSDQIAIAPGATYVAPEDDSETATIRKQIGETIKEYSWKMIFAKDENEFNSLLKKMQDTANGLGYENILKIDMERAKEQTALREEVLKEYKDKK